MPRIKLKPNTSPVTIAFDGDPSSAKTYHENDAHEVLVAEEHVPTFLRMIDGSRLLEDEPDTDPSDGEQSGAQGSLAVESGPQLEAGGDGTAVAGTETAASTETPSTTAPRGGTGSTGRRK